FCPWRDAPSCVAQRAVFFYFSGFLLAAARRAWVGGATRSLGLLRVVLLLVAAQRAGMICVARRAALFRAGGLLVPALRAG
ncbi:hypothetical protein A2U01_0046811, partial [Trifolium medium]|nr:hypothetical protein [Trifolium medium]